MNQREGWRGECILLALKTGPQTTEEVARAAEISIHHARKILRSMRETGEVERHPDFTSQHGYRFRHQLVKDRGRAARQKPKADVPCDHFYGSAGARYVNDAEVARLERAYALLRARCEAAEAALYFHATHAIVTSTSELLEAWRAAKKAHKEGCK